MCRLMAYMGKAIELEELLYQPEHSLVVQSYQPREMTAGLLNADGFGLGWYHAQKSTAPFIYKNILPIWNDVNLPQLARFVSSQCVLGYVRSATPPLAVDFSNCQPFSTEKILFLHNGYIQNFRQTLYKPIRNKLNGHTYELIKGATDSEHIFALVVNELQTQTDKLNIALNNTLMFLTKLAIEHKVYFSGNIIISNGKEIVASRYAWGLEVPTLYWLKEEEVYPESVIIASEPLFKANWKSCPVSSLITIGENLEINIQQLSEREPISNTHRMSM